MQRFLRTHVCIDEDSMQKLNRLRRGSQLTLARLLTTIVQDYLDSLQNAHHRHRIRSVARDPS
jgi:hypothetical protein